MIVKMVFEYRKHLIAQFLIEAWCLEELGPHPVSPQVLLDPEGTDITTAIPGPAFDPSTDALLVIADKDRQPLSIVHPSLRGIILVEAAG
jgi:hypothetical protein